MRSRTRHHFLDVLVLSEHELAQARQELAGLEESVRLLAPYLGCERTVAEAVELLRKDFEVNRERLAPWLAEGLSVGQALLRLHEESDAS